MVVTGARQHRLDIAHRLVEALLDTDADSVIDDLVLPTAVFDGVARTPRVVNAAWRALFGTADVLATNVEEVASTGVALHLADVAVDVGGSLIRCAATLRRSAGRTIVICEDVTDEVVAQQLDVDTRALIWGGLGHAADYTNPSWLAYVGGKRGWEEPIHPEDAASTSKSLAWAIRERGTTEIEIRLRSVSNGYRWHRVRFVASGPRWYATASDIHDVHTIRAERDDLRLRLSAAIEDAETASRLKDQFLAVVSHELRAPLTTIVLWEGVLRDSSADPVLHAKALEAIRVSALSQSRVVGDLLDISRAIAGKLHIDHRPVAIASVIRESIDAHAPAALAKQVTITYRDTVPKAQVDGDAMRLRQVLDNLVSNAVKFTDVGGDVSVTLVRRGRSNVIVVADTGCGITAELLPRLFDPFSQSEDALTRNAGGLGLGLAIARQLVQLHGGTLTAESPGPSHGATMTITLPASAARRVSTPPPGIKQVSGLAQTRVLVIDDDQRVREALALLLARAGAVVETADSAEMGRARIASAAPDVIVCDIAMPGEDGYTFMRALRATRNTVGTIALTAYAGESDVGRALAAGFDRHLAKPIDFERLVTSIDELSVARRTT